MCIRDRFIAEGGYPKAIAAIKNSETGFFDGVGASFSKGTVHIIANNGVHKALGIILIVQIVIALLMLVFEGKIWKWILAIIDFILMGVSGTWLLVKYNQYKKIEKMYYEQADNELIDWDYAGRMVDNWVNSIRDNLKIFLIIAGVAIVLFIVVLMISNGRYAVFSFAISALITCAAMPLAILILENIIGLGIGLATIIVVGIIFLFICSLGGGSSSDSGTVEAFDKMGNFIGWFHKK